MHWPVYVWKEPTCNRMDIMKIFKKFYWIKLKKVCDSINTNVEKKISIKLKLTRFNTYLYLFYIKCKNVLYLVIKFKNILNLVL